MSDENDKTGQSGGFSLEDILAEYKGEAYIAGEKKLPVIEMQKRAEEILKEVYEIKDDPKPKPEPLREHKPTIISFAEAVKAQKEEDDIFETEAEDSDDSELYLNTEREVKTDEKEKDNIKPLEEASAKGRFEDDEPYEDDREEKKPGGFFSGLFGRNKKQTEEEDEPFEDEPEEDMPPLDEIPEDEPDLKLIYKAYSGKASSLRLRSFISAAVCIVLALITFVSDTNYPFPHFLNDKFIPVVCVSLALEIAVIILGFDIIKSGLKDLFTLKAGAESLVAVSCLATVGDAISILVTKSTDRGLPFGVISSFSMFFALLGAFKTARGYMLSFRTAASLTDVYCVTAEGDRLEGGTVLVKSKGNALGFVTKCHKQSFPEKVLTYAAPLLILGSLGLSLIASLGKGNASSFFHCYAAIAAAAAPFSSLMIFGHPFRALAQYLSESGAAIAGWQGACDIGDAVGTVVTDEDIFPAGTLSISGVNIMTGASRDKVLSYTGSMIAMSESGLSEVFKELMKSQMARTVNVKEFSLYEGGGFSGVSAGDRVLVGSSGFMNLMGIRIPENMNMKNAIFCAINDELSGVFLISYNPTRPVQNALVALLSRKMMTLFALRDFNVSTMMIRQKFKIDGKADNIDVLTFGERFRLSEPPAVKHQPSALIFREGLAPYASAVLGGRALQTAVRIGTVISVLSAAFGLVFVFYMCAKGAFTAVTAANLLVFMLAWLLPTYFLSRMVKG